MRAERLRRALVANMESERKLTANFNGGLELKEHWLLHEDLPRDFAKERDVLLADLDIASAGVDHFVDDGINV